MRREAPRQPNFAAERIGSFVQSAVHKASRRVHAIRRLAAHNDLLKARRIYRGDITKADRDQYIDRQWKIAAKLPPSSEGAIAVGMPAITAYIPPTPPTEQQLRLREQMLRAVESLTPEQVDDALRLNAEKKLKSFL